MTEILGLAAMAVFIYMTAVYIIAVRMRNYGIVDVAWGGGFVLVAVLSLLRGGNFHARQILVTSLVAIWGLRLALHIYLRGRGKGEDKRYREWREQWGKKHLLNAFFQVFMLQGLLLLIISYPIILINASSSKGLTVLDYIGAGIWLAGFLFEAIADYQLVHFKSNSENKGKLMTEGLWSYTRHPNYFGESVVWWGIYFIALSIPGGWKTVFSPILITLLVRYVSGVVLLEKHMQGREGFEEYKENTPPFFPCFFGNKQSDTQTS